MLKSENLFKDECIFKPQVSTHSSQIVKKSRDSSQKGNYRMYESLTDKMRKTNEWRTRQQSQKDYELMKECTFTPEVLSNSTRMGLSSIMNQSHSQRLLNYPKADEKHSRHSTSKSNDRIKQ